MQYFCHFEHVGCTQVFVFLFLVFGSAMLFGMLCANECYVMRYKSVGGWCDCGLVVRCVNSLCVWDCCCECGV